MDSPKDILDRIHNSTSPIPEANGVFGDMEDCDGLVEEVLTPETGGTFLKLFGNTMLFKGLPMRDVVENLGVAKSLISMIPREILGKSHAFQLSILAIFLFAKKRFWHYVLVYSYNIWTNTSRKLNYNPSKFGVVPNELRRSFHAVITRHTGEEVSLRQLSPQELNTPSENDRWLALAYFGEFVFLFIELDCAYRFRLQDILGELNKEHLKQSPTKEIARLFDILIQRDHDQPYKWIQLKRLIVPVLYASKDLREMFKEILLELDTQQTAFDEHDRYFCLKRKGYDFWGLPLAPRLFERERIDKEKEHVILHSRPVRGITCQHCSKQTYIGDKELNEAPLSKQFYV